MLWGFRHLNCDERLRLSLSSAWLCGNYCTALCVCVRHPYDHRQDSLCGSHLDADGLSRPSNLLFCFFYEILLKYCCSHGMTHTVAQSGVIRSGVHFHDNPLYHQMIDVVCYALVAHE